MSVLITLIIPLVGVIPSFHQNAMFMEFASYLISIPLRLISLIVSIPFAVFGSIFDLLFKKYPDEPHTILITGASSGICKEVALQYAKPVEVVRTSL